MRSVDGDFKVLAWPGTGPLWRHHGTADIPGRGYTQTESSLHKGSRGACLLAEVLEVDWVTTSCSGTEIPEESKSIWEFPKIRGPFWESL